MKKIEVEVLEGSAIERCKTAYLLVPAIVVCESLNVEVPVTFLVDTGATYTTLHHRDFVRLAVGYNELDRVGRDQWLQGIAGEVETCLMRDVTICFRTTDDSEELLEIDLDCINVVKLAEGSSEGARKCPSLLGEDILRRIRLVSHPCEGETYLEIPA